MDTHGTQQTPLGERLAERQRQQISEVERLTKERLTQLAESFMQHVDDELRTTKIDITQRGSEIKKSLIRIETQLESTTTQMSTRLRELSRMPDEELAELSERLSYDLKKSHKKAINQSVTLLRRSLVRLRGDSKRLQVTVLNIWLTRLMLSITTGVGLLIAVVMCTHALDQLLTHRLAKLSDLNQVISDQQKVMAQLEDQTWGVKLVHSEEGQFIILPTGMTVETNWKLNNEERIVLKIKREE